MKWFVFAFLLIMRPLCAFAGPAEYAFVREVLSVPRQEELVALELDAVIWSVSGGMPPDIRIADRGGVVIPHMLRKAGEKRLRTVREPVASTVRGLEELPDNRIVLTVVLGENAPAATGLELVTPLKDFERQITVEGLRDDGTSETLVDGALIYDYARFADVRRCDVGLPQNAFRQFRVTIGNVTDEQQSPQRQISRTFEQGAEVRVIDESTVTTRPFRMDRVVFFAERQAESHTVEREVRLPVKSWSVDEDHARRGQTVIEIETHAEPVHGFVLQIGDRNFTRRVRVEASGGSGSGDGWVQIGGATLSRIAFRHLQHEHLRVTFGERRAARYRLVIDNQDTPPLAVTGIEGVGPVWQACYIGGAGQEARLYYGKDMPRPPQYETDPIERILDGGYEPVVYALGDQQGNDAFRKRGFALTTLVGSRFFFIGAVVVMVGVMAGALVRAAKRI